MVAAGAVMTAEPPFIHSFVALLCLVTDLIFHEHVSQTETFLEDDRFIPRNWSNKLWCLNKHYVENVESGIEFVNVLLLEFKLIFYFLFDYFKN